MKPPFKIFIFFVILITGIGFLGNNLNANYSNFDVSQNVDVPNKSKLDLFLNRVLEARQEFTSEQNYLVFVSKVENKLSTLRNNYSSSTEIDSMLNYLETGIVRIRNISNQNNDIDDFFCELFGDCTGNNNSSSNININSNNTDTNNIPNNSCSSSNSINNNWGVNLPSRNNGQVVSIDSNVDTSRGEVSQRKFKCYNGTWESDGFVYSRCFQGYNLSGDQCVARSSSNEQNGNDDQNINTGNETSDSNDNKNNDLKLDSSSISSNGIVSCKFVGKKDTLSIS